MEKLKTGPCRTVTKILRHVPVSPNVEDRSSRLISQILKLCSPPRGGNFAQKIQSLGTYIKSLIPFLRDILDRLDIYFIYCIDRDKFRSSSLVR